MTTLKYVLNNWAGICVLNLSATENVRGAGFYEHCNELLGSIKGPEFLECLKNFLLVKRDFPLSVIWECVGNAFVFDVP